MCNDVKNIISHGFETCYDWRPVLELLLEAACENYFMIQVLDQLAWCARNQNRRRSTLFSGYREEGGAEAQKLAHYFPGSLVFFLESVNEKNLKSLVLHSLFVFVSDGLMICW